MKTLLDIAYATMGERPAIQLFYKEKSSKVDGRNVEEVTDFEPYFYATGDESLPGELKGLGKVVSVEKKRMIYLKEAVDVFRIAVSSPGDVPELRERAKKLPGCFGVFEADIPFVRRYMIDSQLTPMENAEEIGLNVAAFDLEVYNALGEPKAERDPIICLSYADSGGVQKVFSYKNLGINEDYIEILENEAAVITRFVELIKSRSIDIIVSYNADNFDFPYIIERAKKLKLPLPLGIDGSDVKMERRGMNMGAKVRGRPHVDMYPVCRGAFNLPRYTLEDVYKGLFGKEKLDIDGMRIHEYWDSKDPKVLKELFDYSLSDVVATLEIATRMLPLQYEMSRIVREPIYEVSRMGSGQKVEQLLIENAFRQNMLVPNKPHEGDVKARESKSYVGGYVVEPKRGIHDNISLFDFRSLYPSVIISHNIDPATIDCKCCNVGHKAPTGHFFCMDKKGFIPGIIEGLVKKRVAIKKRLKETNDQKEKLVLTVQQEAVKILTNSFYGYLAFARARWYSKECAEATSAFGRQYIHKTVKSAKDAGFEVVYGDTDSIFITMEETDAEKIKKKSIEFMKGINRELPETMELEFEGFYPRGIFITKKRYALMNEDGEMIVKGLETRRRDWANVAKHTQQKVLYTILHEKNPQKAAQIVKEMVQKIKSGGVDMDDLVINTRLTQSIKSYKNVGPHVMAVKKGKERGIDIKEGEVVPYIITKKGTSISDRAVLANLAEKGDYDPDYYINNQVLPAVMRVLEALGYSEQELKGLGKQMSLGDF